MSATYKVIACGGRVVPSGKFQSDFKPSCGWVYPANAVGHAMVNQCPRCTGSLDRFAQSSDPSLLVEWCVDNHLEVPMWLDDLVHAV